MDTIVHIGFRTQTRGYTLLLEIDLLGERMGESWHLSQLPGHYPKIRASRRCQQKARNKMDNTEEYKETPEEKSHAKSFNL